MERSIINISSPLRTCNPLNSRLLCPRTGLKSTNKRNKIKISAIRRERDAYEHGGHEYYSTDEDLIVLRKRIQEVKMAERNYETPSEWMEWERRYYVDGYNSDVCKVLGILQTLLINSRPGYGLAMALVVCLSLPVSVLLVLSHSFEFAKFLLAAVHVG